MKQIRFNDLAVGKAVSDGACAKNIVISDRSVYFTTEEGAFVRLAYEGKRGWRLQANAKGYSDFDVIGAAQSLAFFLNEEVSDVSLPLDISAEEGKIVLTAENGEQAILTTSSALCCISLRYNFRSLKGI